MQIGACASAQHAAARHVSRTDPKGIRVITPPIDCRTAPESAKSAGMHFLSAAVCRPSVCRAHAARAGKRLVAAIGRRSISTRAQTGSGGLTEEGRRAATRDAADRFRADQL